MADTEFSEKSGGKTLKSGVSAGINAGFKLAKAGEKAAIKSAAKSILLGGLSIETLAVLGIAMVIIIIPLILISIIPSGSLFQTKAEMSTAESKVASAVSYSYRTEIKSAKRQILEFVQTNYPDANARMGDFIEDSSGFDIDNDTCSISVSFAPSVSTMSTNITAYANAVHGTIAYFESQGEEAVSFDSNMTELDKNGEVMLSKDAKEYLDEHATELTNANATEFINAVGLGSRNFFVYDEDETRWERSNFHQGPKTHIETRTKTVPDGVDPKTGETKYKIETYEVEVTETAWYGDIDILMFYDLSDYRSEDIDKCIEIAGDLTIAGNKIQDPVSLVSNTLENYYNSYIGYSNGSFINGKFKEGSDNREEIFSKLLSDGTLMYIPISGLSSRFTEGEPGYSGDIGFSKYDGKSSSSIWADIQKQRNAGNIGSGTEMWNCTAFAEAWFYEIYGVDALYGNGCNMVENLLKSDFGKENFYRGSSPAPGGIFSIGSAYGANHVGCIDAVDYENKTITFSDGNTNGAADSTSTIRIKKTMTFEEFQTHIKASRMATTGSSSGWITFANPNEGLNK